MIANRRRLAIALFFCRVRCAHVALGALRAVGAGGVEYCAERALGAGAVEEGAGVGGGYRGRRARKLG